MLAGESQLDTLGTDPLAPKRQHIPSTFWMTMNLNFFDWLRDAVRRSVLAGMGDAVEQLGPPPEGDDLPPVLAAAMAAQDGPAKVTSNRRSTKAGGTTATRKRLGKSLKDMEPIGKK